MNDHKDLIIKPRDTDYIFGSNSPIELSGTVTSWLPYVEFYERQLLSDGDSNGCVLFTSQESFDAQMEYLIQSGKISADLLIWFDLNGYMDLGTDGKKHFHTSPRYLQILTGNGFDGNSIQEAWDAMRAHGCIPYTDLPTNVTKEEYLNPIPQPLLDKGSLFLSKIGGKQAIGYHWVVNNGQNVPAMAKALTTAPLCLGVNVGSNWNTITPPAPAGGDPGHCVMNYQITNGNCWVYDHYLPNPKELVSGYPIPYALQGILQPIIVPVPTPIPPPLPPVLPTQQNVNILTQILALYQKIIDLIRGK